MTSSISATGILHTSSMLAGYLVDSGIKISVLLVLASTVFLALRKSSAAIRHFAWSTTLTAALLLPAMTFSLPQWQVLPTWVTFSHIASSTQHLDEKTDSQVDIKSQERSPVAITVIEPQTKWEPDSAIQLPATHPTNTPGGPISMISSETSFVQGPSLLKLCALLFCGVWMLGVLVLTARLAYGIWTLRILPRHLKRMTNDRLIEMLQQTAKELRTAPPLLYEGVRDTMPMVWGIARSRLVLPSGTGSWHPEQVRAVLLHELAHVRRRDPLTQLVAQFTLTLHWLNPLVWWAVGQLRREQEHACDDIVLLADVSASTYAGHVLDLVTETRTRSNVANLALTMSQPIELETRLRTILEVGRSRVPISLRVAMLMFVGVTAATVCLSMAQAEPGFPAEQAASQTSKPEPATAATPAVSAPALATTSEDDVARGPVVLGLNLKDKPFKKEAKDLPDLYESFPDQPGFWQQRHDVFEMHLNQDTYTLLKYPVSSGRYYIEYRDEWRKPETERTYGPFEGDPFDDLNLVNTLAFQLNRAEFGFDLSERVRSMLRLGNAKIAKSAAQLMLAALDSEVLDPGSMEARVVAVRAILNDYSDTFKKQGLTNESETLNARVAHLEQLIDQLTVEIPNSEYLRAVPGIDLSQLPKKVPEYRWGPEVNGLRLALFPDPHSRFQHGDPVTITLVVENVSDHDIKFSSNELLLQVRADVQQAYTQDQVRTSGPKFSGKTTWSLGGPRIQHYLVRAKGKIAIARPSVVVLDQEDPSAPVVGRTQIIAGSGEYLVRYDVDLGVNSTWKRGTDGVTRKLYPAKGEWVGTLQSRQIVFQSMSAATKKP